MVWLFASATSLRDFIPSVEGHYKCSSSDSLIRFASAVTTKAVQVPPKPLNCLVINSVFLFFQNGNSEYLKGHRHELKLGSRKQAKFTEIMALRFVVISSLLLVVNGGGSRSTVGHSAAAEYFYANDKLADSEVAQFVNSRQQQNQSTMGIRPMVTTTTSTTATVINNQQHRPLYPTLTSHTGATRHFSQSSSISSGSRTKPKELLIARPAVLYNQSPGYIVPRPRTPPPPQDIEPEHPVQPVYIPPETVLRIDAFKTGNISTTENQTTIQNPVVEENLSVSFRNRWANMTFTLKDEQWVAPIIALSLLNMMVIVVFEGFVIYRACR